MIVRFIGQIWEGERSINYKKYPIKDLLILEEVYYNSFILLHTENSLNHYRNIHYDLFPHNDTINIFQYSFDEKFVVIHFYFVKIYKRRSNSTIWQLQPKFDWCTLRVFCILVPFLAHGRQKKYKNCITISNAPAFVIMTNSCVYGIYPWVVCFETKWTVKFSVTQQKIKRTIHMPLLI